MFNKLLLLLWLFCLLLHPVATASMLYFIDREKNAVVVWMLNRENKKKLEQKAVEVDDSSSLLRLSTDEIPTEWNSKISDKTLSGSTYGTFSWFKFTTTTMRNSHSWTRRATTDHNNGNRISHFFHLLSPRLSKKHSARRWRCVGLHQAATTAIETHRISYAFVWPSAKEKDHFFFEVVSSPLSGPSLSQIRDLVWWTNQT